MNGEEALLLWPRTAHSKQKVCTPRVARGLPLAGREGDARLALAEIGRSLIDPLPLFMSSHEDATAAPRRKRIHALDSGMHMRLRPPLFDELRSETRHALSARAPANVRAAYPRARRDARRAAVPGTCKALAERRSGIAGPRRRLPRVAPRGGGHDVDYMNRGARFALEK